MVGWDLHKQLQLLSVRVMGKDYENSGNGLLKLKIIQWREIRVMLFRKTSIYGKLVHLSFLHKILFEVWIWPQLLDLLLVHINLHK